MALEECPKCGKQTLSSRTVTKTRDAILKPNFGEKIIKTETVYYKCLKCGYKSQTSDVGCLAGDTQILLADGTTKKIQSLKVGDTVVSPRADGSLAPCSVKNIIIGRSTIIFISHGGGQALRTSASHKFMTDRGARRADEIRVGDLVGVLQSDNTFSWSAVNGKTESQEKRPVFNVRLNGSGTVLAGGLVAYNYSHCRQGREFFNHVENAMRDGARLLRAGFTSALRHIRPNLQKEIEHVVSGRA